MRVRLLPFALALFRACGRSSERLASGILALDFMAPVGGNAGRGFFFLVSLRREGITALPLAVMKSPLNPKGPQFTRAFNRFIRSPRVSVNAKVIFLIIKSHAGKTSDPYPSVETLEECSGLSRSVVFRALKELKELEVMQIINRRNQSSVYLLDDEHWVKIDASNNIGVGVKSDTPGSVISDTSRGVKSDTRSRTKEVEPPLPENVIRFEQRQERAV